MSKTNKSSDQCIQPSELTAEQLASLPFVPGNINSFDEKNSLPPTARPQWNCVQINPAEYIERFSAELALLGVNIAICFVNKEIYEDKTKDLKSPVTVNLLVKPELFGDIKSHLEGKKLSFLVMENGQGFSLPYLGTIQKALDTLALEKIVNYVFIKNSISRESYFTWLSLPKTYLQSLLSVSKKTTLSENSGDRKDSDNSTTVPEPANNFRPSRSRKKQEIKENFNYVVYDEEEVEIDPPVAPEMELQANPTSVIVATGPGKKKRPAFFNLAAGFNTKKVKPEDQNISGKKSAGTKFDSLLFLALSLFNFYSSLLLVTFVGRTIQAVGAIMVESVTIAALLSILFALLVIHPSFRNAGTRLWALSAYVIYSAVAGFHIYQSLNFPDSAGYLLFTALALVCLAAAIMSAFMRIDRMSLSSPSKIQEKHEEAVADEAQSVVAEKENNIPVRKDLPPPVRPNPKQTQPSRIEFKPKKVHEVKPIPVPQRPIPSQPISEAQKDIIRNRLTRTDLLSKPAASQAGVSTSTTSLSSKASVSGELETTPNPQLNGAPPIAEGYVKKSIQLQRQGGNSSPLSTSEESDKLSLPKTK